MPDVAFFSWDRLPDRRVPDEPILTLSPDLAVEVLSKSNTPREMERKYKEYFRSSVRLVWEFDPRKQSVRVLKPGIKPQELSHDDILSGEARPAWLHVAVESALRTNGPARLNRNGIRPKRQSVSEGPRWESFADASGFPITLPAELKPPS